MTTDAPVAARTSCYVGVDMGTSGCRAVAIDESGTVLADARQDFSSPRTDAASPPAWSLLLEQTLLALTARLVASGKSPSPLSSIRCIAVSATSGSVLPVDHLGEPAGPALMYNDARARPQARRIAEVAPRTSAAHGPTSGLAKLLWIKEYINGSNDLRVVSQADWLAGKLGGRYDLSDENNCLKLGYDPVSRCWPAWLESLGLDHGQLATVLPPGSPAAEMKPGLAGRLGWPAGVCVATGTTDSIAAFLAAGAQGPGEGVTSLGSTLAIKLLSDKPVFSPRHGVYSHRLWDLWLAGGASNSGGAVLRAHFSRQEMDAMTPRLRPDEPTGLDYYPLPEPGERFPVADPALPPRLEPRPADDQVFFQAMLEGIAHIEAEGYRLLASLGAPPVNRVITTGGGAVNQAWQAIRQYSLGVPVVRAQHTEAAYGSALLARRAVANVTA